MRKLLIKTMVLSVLAAVYLTLSAAANAGAAVVDADSLRVRSEPTTESSTLTYLLDGTRVTVHEVLDGWYYVSYGDYTGYVSADYVIYTPAQEPALPEEEPVAAAAAAVSDSAANQEAGSVTDQATITGSDVNLRSGPSTGHDVLQTLAQGTQVTLLSTEDGWCQVSLDGVAGYVSAEYVVQAAPRIIVTGDCVNIRHIASTEGSILAKVYAGSVLDVLAEENGWYQISSDGVTGYICGDYARQYNGSAASSIGDDVVSLALSYLGTPYSYGGSSPKGFDCSGFTMYIFKQFGYSLPHSATSQWNSSGEHVERADLQPGDLVMFCDPSRSNGKACSHVGIYIGNNEFVHASSGSSGKYVRISSLGEGYYNTYYKGAKRLG